MLNSKYLQKIKNHNQKKQLFESRTVQIIWHMLIKQSIKTRIEIFCGLGKYSCIHRIFILCLKDTEVFINFPNIIIQVISPHISLWAHATIKLYITIFQIKLPQYISSIGQSRYHHATREIKRSLVHLLFALKLSLIICKRQKPYDFFLRN